MHSTSDLKRFCREHGANLVGIADLGPLKKGLVTIPHDLLNRYSYAVSVAVTLDTDIINTINRGPTPEYAEHCRNINAVLDDLTVEIVDVILRKGFHAEAIPASRWEDNKNLLGGISHKAVARMAGLGWQGKSLLIVSPEFGPRIRLSTVLTDMPLTPDHPLKNRCGKCIECVKACPASAIKNISTESHYAERDEAIDLQGCLHKLLEFKELPGIGYTFCGVCIQACPFGKRKRL